jgi:foldase protein PrsA
MTRVLPSRQCFPCVLAVIGITVGLLLAAGCGDRGGRASQSSGSPAADAVVATVDGDRVRAHEVELVRAERRFIGQGDAAGPALDEAVRRTLMRREAARLGAVADETEIGRRLAEVETTAGGASALDVLLQRARMSRSQLRQSVTDGVLREALRDAKYPGKSVTPQDVRAYYRRNRARLFTQPAQVRLGALQVRTERVAANAIARLDQGRPFTEVARQFSVDPETRDKGGELGWILTSSLPPVLQKAVAGAGTGVIRRPVGAGNVWYVLNIEAQRPSRVMRLSEVRDRLTTELTRVKRSKALERWLDAARERSTVTTP